MLPSKVRISDMPTAPKTIAIVVGHKDKDDRAHLGQLVKLIVEGQKVNRTPLDRIYTATIPTPGKENWWETLRLKSKDKTIHTLR